MSYRIIAIGPRHDPQLAAAVADYEKRLGRFGGVQWRLLPYSPLEGTAARRAESLDILSKIKDGELLVLLDERGLELTSEGLAKRLEGWRGSGKRLTFVIGGAYGVDESLHRRADFVWSLSSLVFPHQLVRLILIEQLYRAHTILDNHPYHHS